MSDFLLELGQKPVARRLFKTLGLPLPLPQALRRERGPWTAEPLKEHKVVVGAAPDSTLLGTIGAGLAAAGAETFFVAAPGASFTPLTEACSARDLATLGDEARLDALVFDASGIADAGGLRALYDFFHPLIARLDRSARVVVLARPRAGLSPVQAMAQAAVEGFVRSVAKELGRAGGTANFIVVDEGAEARAPAVLRFLLSARSAFITGQPLHVTARAKMDREEALFVRSLDKKVALVTGAARGIGAATARALADEGAHVVCVDRPEDEGATAELAREIGGQALFVDVTAAEAPAKIAAALGERGGVDIVVHNAGITRDKTLRRMKPEAWDAVMRVNLQAVASVTAALEQGVLRDGGRVICLSSVAGIAGNMGQTNYAASKAGVVGYVRALGERLAPRGITVNAIAPGFIETRLTAAIPFAIREVARRLSALSQGGQPEDVAQAIVFLASPGAQGLCGDTLRVCGGAFVGA